MIQYWCSNAGQCPFITRPQTEISRSEFAFRAADFFLLTLCPHSQKRQQQTPDLTCEHDRQGYSGNHALEAIAKLDWYEKKKRETGATREMQARDVGCLSSILIQQWKGRDTRSTSSGSPCRVRSLSLQNKKRCSSQATKG